MCGNVDENTGSFFPLCLVCLDKLLGGCGVGVGVRWLRAWLRGFETSNYGLAQTSRCAFVPLSIAWCGARAVAVGAGGGAGDWARKPSGSDRVLIGSRSQLCRRYREA